MITEKQSVTAKAQEMLQHLKIGDREKGFHSTFEIQTEEFGTKSGEVYIVKEKSSGEVVVYVVPED